MQKDNKKDFIDPIIGGSLLSILGIGVIEIFKVIIGFFTWMALKRWWDSCHGEKGKDERPDNPISGEE